MYDMKACTQIIYLDSIMGNIISIAIRNIYALKKIIVFKVGPFMI